MAPRHLTGAAVLCVDCGRPSRQSPSCAECEAKNPTPHPIFKQTRLVKGSTGRPALNPLASYLVSLLTELQATETELGMTRLARQRLGIAYGQARMMVYELNRILNERPAQPRVVEGWQAEWEDA